MAYGEPDVVYLMSGRNVFTFYQGKVTDAGLGIGYVCGVCTEYYVALGEDNPGLFNGMHTFTHELAHLLGAKHDGDGPNVAMPGHPGAKNCSWNLGHIMSYINNGPSHHRFSWCTLQQIRYVLSRAGERCWKDTYRKAHLCTTFTREWKCRFENSARSCLMTKKTPRTTMSPSTKRIAECAAISTKRTRIEDIMAWKVSG
ncbi:hypothetical protein MTO96_014765 [Rhipicephalus appendiculatus]